MKMTKRNSSLIAVLLLTAAANVYSMEKQSFPVDLLPRDMQREVMVTMANNTITNLPRNVEGLKIAAQEVRNLCLTNKELNGIINQPEFTFKLIKNFAKAFNCYEGTVAKALATRGAQERDKLQEDFIDDAVMGYKQFSAQVFDSFLRRGVDLEWVEMYGNTPLMLAVQGNKLAAVKALIKNGADVNHAVILHDMDGNVVEGTCDTVLSNILTKNISPELGIKKVPTSQVLEMIKVLLDAGADPKVACDDRLTRVEQYSDRPEVIKAIKDAQTKKRVQE